MIKKISILLLSFLLFGFCLEADGKMYKSQIPPSQMQDQITQNKGNIATTVQNWGQIGGQSHLGKPSGEWPKGSGRSYLAEIKYWMGAVKSNGDTVVANSDDDFMPLPSLIQGKESYRIHLSTVTSSYDYDPSDTVGLGIGKPAYGWRVFDNQMNTWVYNRVWTLSSGFVQAGPVSLQESHYRFNDANSGVAKLGLEMTQTIYQWNYS
ncbi:MAG: hypothetical protein ABII96_09160, partial [Candidatus Zixiibacteriota bacterium]